MNIIYGKDQTGKTTDLIKICAKEGGYIVCYSSDESAMVYKLSKKLDLEINMPITFKEMIAGNFKGNVYIDDIDLCLRDFSKDVNVKAIAVTKPEKTVYSMPENGYVDLDAAGCGDE